MARRPPHIPRRRLAFVGCEGESEVAYVALLNQIAETRNIPVWFRAERLNPGAGDPTQLVNLAIERLKTARKKGRQFAVSAVLLDNDRFDDLGQNRENLQQTAQNAKLLLVFQHPDHEGFLLRHFLGCESLRPPSGYALQELRRRWPEYEKGRIPRIELAKRISFEDIERVCRVEPELRELLTRTGLLRA